jgi:flagellar basal-body rod protein FlgB
MAQSSISSEGAPMNEIKSALMSGLAARMQHLSRRTAVIAENIANADTPGFVARDVAEPSLSKAPSLRVSDPRHATHANAPSETRIVAAPDGEAAINGNEVSLETQMMKLSQTRADYQLVSSVYKKALDMIRLAAGGRS